MVEGWVGRPESAGLRLRHLKQGQSARKPRMEREDEGVGRTLVLGHMIAWPLTHLRQHRRQHLR